jgi:exodeoxyribonuclease-5
MSETSAKIQSIRSVKLTAHQQAAYNLLEKFLSEPAGSMAVLEGYAGTGKTTLIGELVRSYADIRQIALAAPTNKAVAVLSAKVGVPVASGSIHSFLGLRMVEKENGDQECKPEGEPSLEEYGLLILDECSMVSEELFRHICMHKGPCRILFVGDPAQLPPVGEKEISPVFRLVDFKVRLSEVVRQAADNPIIALSMKVRKWIEEDRRPTGADISGAIPKVYPMRAAIEPGTIDTIREYALWAIQKDKQTCRIIAFTNARVREHNTRLHDAIYGMTAFPFCVGETVIAQEQFEALPVFEEGEQPLGRIEKVRIINSEELEVTAVEPYSYSKYPGIPGCKVTLRRDDDELVQVVVAVDHTLHDSAVAKAFSDWRKVKFDYEQRRNQAGSEELREKAKQLSMDAWMLKKAFAPVRHAYAVTAHKSQGSTFHTVIVDFGDLSKIRSAFDFNRALYVAATRASDHLAIVA